MQIPSSQCPRVTPSLQTHIPLFRTHAQNPQAPGGCVRLASTPEHTSPGWTLSQQTLALQRQLGGENQINSPPPHPETSGVSGAVPPLPPRPLRKAPLRKPAAERVSGAGGRGRQECRTPTGAGRLKLPRWPPPPRPPALHPGSSCSLPPDPRVQLRRSLPRRQTPCTAGLAPGGSARSPGPDLSPRPIPGLPGGRRTRAGPPPGPRPRAGGRTGPPARPHPHAGDGAARRPPGKDKGCSAAGRTVPGSPRPPPRWPPTPPPLRLLRRPGLHSPDGVREEAASLGPCTPDILRELRSHSPLLRVSWPVEVALSP